MSNVSEKLARLSCEQLCMVRHLQRAPDF